MTFRVMAFTCPPHAARRVDAGRGATQLGRPAPSRKHKGGEACCSWDKSEFWTKSMREVLGLKQMLVRERQQLEGRATAERPCASPACERHFSVAEVAKMWNLSPDAVRKLFEREPGVVVISNESRRRGRSIRRYRTLRIPESVVVRVHQRLSNVAA